MSAARIIIDNSIRLLGLIKNRLQITPKIRSKDGRICINLGCGLAVAPGWINVDASLNALIGGAPRWMLSIFYNFSGANRYYSLSQYCRLLREHTFIFHDVSRSFPFHPQSVDVIYSSHFFEHLFKNDAERLMRDAFASLKPGGIMRIAVPDLDYAIKLYQAGHKQRMLEDYFFVEDRSSYLARHKFMYDFELLQSALRKAGFENIRRCSYQQGDTPDITILDNRPEETLFVEAYR
jgi:predicted SAM-dependent methyltransferase